MPTRHFGLRSLVSSEITKSSWKVYIIPIRPPKDFSWKTFSTEGIIHPTESSDKGRTVGLKQYAFKGIWTSRFRPLLSPKRIPSGHFHSNWRIHQKGKSLQCGSHVSDTVTKDANSGGSPWPPESRRGLLIRRPAGGYTRYLEHGSAFLCLSPPVLLLEALDEMLSPDPNKNIC